MASFLTAFGFHNSHSTERSYVEMPNGEKRHFDCRYFNLHNTMGYLPLLGLFTAAKRFKSIIDRQNIQSLSGFNFAIAFRGILEAVGLGIILFCIDIIVTIGRLIAGSYKPIIHGVIQIF